MFLTRRTFIQSSLAASLAVAAEATGAGWLLNPDHPIRIAIAGLGPAAEEHISLFAALPGVHIVALADTSNSKRQAALAQLTALGRPRPSLYSSLFSLLGHAAIDAFSLPVDVNSAADSLKELLATRLPVFTDLPPRDLSHGEFLALQQAPVRLRTTDRLYPGARSNIHAQWKRQSPQPEPGLQPCSARLVLERRLPPPQLRAVLIAALEAILDPHLTPAAPLAAWSQDPGVIKITRASTVLQVHLARHISPFERLEVDLLPRSSGASILSLGQSNRTIQVPIWRVPDSRSSLCTVMGFLNQTRASFGKRTPGSAIYTAERATNASVSFAAAAVVDRALTV
jgi:hypothetical protein